MKSVAQDRIVKAEFVAAASAPDQLPPPTFVEVAFAGRSNVGKSSLLNTLMNRHSLARTSSTPGCTRTITFFEVELSSGAKARFVDLPGYGYARRSKTERGAWAELIERYLLERVSLRALVLLMDVRRGLEEEERDLLEMMTTSATSRSPVRSILVATKLDKLPASAAKSGLAALGKKLQLPIIGFSSKTAMGRDELLAKIQRFADLVVDDPTTVKKDGGGAAAPQ
jgi:GTP-binding protein